MKKKGIFVVAFVAAISILLVFLSINNSSQEPYPDAKLTIEDVSEEFSDSDTENTQKETQEPTVKKPLPNAQKVSFAASKNTLNFKIDLGKGIKKKVAIVQSAFAEEKNNQWSNGQTTVQAIVKKPDGKGADSIDVSVAPPQENQYLSITVTNKNPLLFTPGSYSLEVTILENGGQRDITQDFTWGVLAINTDKSVYHSGESADISLAVLDDTAKMVCDSDMTLEIKDPNSQIKTLTTKDKSIWVNPACKEKTLQDKPDYEAVYTTGAAGTYTMTLNAKTPNGQHTIIDTFEVKDDIPFEVKRESATRIYPINSYPVTLTITSKENFNGVITETIPQGFRITDIDHENFNITTKTGNTQQGETYNYQLISWKANLKKGEVRKLMYLYDAPDENPQFYLLGPLTFEETGKTVFKEFRQWQIAVDDSTSSEVTPNADNGAQGWTCTAGTDGNCTTGHYTVVDDGSGSPSTSGYVDVASGGGSGETDAWDTTTFTPTGTLVAVTSVTVYVYDNSTTNANGGTMDSISLSVYMGGAYQANQDVTPSFNSWGWQSKTFTGTWTQSDIDSLRIRVIRNKLGSGNPSSQADNVQIAAAYATVTYTYTNPPPKLTQEGYTFENDDEDQATGDAVDSNTVQAGTSFTSGKTLTSVKKGERLTVRMQVSNTASASASQKFGLFYDRNDGMWSKVEATSSALTGSGSGCDGGSSAWNCTNVYPGTIGKTSLAFDKFGKAWVAFYNAGSAQNLAVAEYVGSGGTGCNGGSSAWNCTQVDVTGNNGDETSMAIDSSGYPWISYVDGDSQNLMVARYVGSGGTGCDGGSTEWTCTAVDVTDFEGYSTSIAFDSSGAAWVSYADLGPSAADVNLMVAKYVGSGGTGCDGGSSAWTCTSVDVTDLVGLNTSIAFDQSNTAWVSYYDSTNTYLMVAKYVGSGGTGCDGGSSAWTCTIVDATDDVGSYTSIAFDPNGAPWVSYTDNTNHYVMVAKYVSSGGSGCDGGSSAWTCTDVDTLNDVPTYTTSIAFDPSGTPWVSYYDPGSNDNLMVARYVGSGGSGCDTSSWTCTAVDVTGDVGGYNSIAFDPHGIPWISYRDAPSGSLMVARLNRGGEISATPGLAGATGDSIQASHADMTSASDSSNKSDADCLSATTWNNGKWFEGEEGIGWSIADGSATPQCTEIAFTIDTSKAVEGTTYRLVLATNDSTRKDKSKWRGPIAVSTNAYPTFTIATTTKKYSKDAMPHFSACTSSSWGCETIDSSVDAGTFWIGLTFDGGGTPFVSYYDATNTKLKVAQYVGSSGNCTSSKWNCTTIDTNAAANGGNSSIATSPRGNVWVSYRDSTNGNLKVATNYDDPTMSACTASGWDCTTVDATAAQLGYESSIAFDKGGNPWVAYRDSTNGDLRVAQYVGGTGGNCTDPAWNCTAVDTSDTAVGDGTSIAFDANGMAWVSYYDNSTNTNLKVANYVGSAGNCSSTAWNCQTVDNNNTNGEYTSIAINPTTNLPWVAYYTLASSNVTVVANYVGDGTGNCSGNTNWNCTTVTASSPIGSDPSLAFDANGTAWFNYFRYVDASHNDLTVAKYVGSGGNCASTAWSCTSVDATVANVGEYASSRALAIDKSGTPWVAYRNNTNTSLKIAKLNLPPSYSQLRYKIDAGTAPATESGSCSSTTDNKGYCGIASDDSDYDSITSGATEQPIYNFSNRYSSNSTAPTISWKGRTNVAPSTSGTAGDLTLQIYRFGSTNAWETVTSDTTSSNCSTADCSLSGTPAGTASEYYQSDGSYYWSYVRVYQTDNSSSQTLKTGYFNAYVIGPLDHYLVTIATPQTAGVCATGTNSVTAQDVDNNTVTSDTSTVNMTYSGTSVTFYTASNCLSSTTQYTLSSGVANIYYKTNKAQSTTITATKNASTETGTSSSVTVNPNSQTRLVITLPSETFTAGSGNSGSVDTQTAGTPFTITSITATDDYFNIITGYSGSKTLSYSGPSGSPSYTTSVNFTSGQSTTTLTTNLTTAETTTITATDGGLYGYASSSLSVLSAGSAGSSSVRRGVTIRRGTTIRR